MHFVFVVKRYNKLTQVVNQKDKTYTLKILIIT